MEARQKLFEQITYSLKNEPEDWSFGDYTAENKKWMIEVWTSNGWNFISVYRPAKIKFSLIQRFKLGKAIQEAKSLKVIKQKPSN